MASRGEPFNVSDRNGRSVKVPLNSKELNPDSSPQAAFGARLRSLREARGWTQEELGERTGIPARIFQPSKLVGNLRPCASRAARTVPSASGTRRTRSSASTARSDTAACWRASRSSSVTRGGPQRSGCTKWASSPGCSRHPSTQRSWRTAPSGGEQSPTSRHSERVTLVAERQAALDPDAPATGLRGAGRELSPSARRRTRRHGRPVGTADRVRRAAEHRAPGRPVQHGGAPSVRPAGHRPHDAGPLAHVVRRVRAAGPSRTGQARSSCPY